MSLTTAVETANSLLVELDDRILRIAVELVTPERAKELLSLNSNNRDINAGNVAKLSRYLADGDFIFNGDTVCVSEDDVLLDGQHRLMAIEASGIAAPCIIVTGIDPKALATIDQNAPRNLSAVLKLQNVDLRNSTIIGSVARLVVLYSDRPHRNALSSDRIFLADYVKENVDTLNAVASMVKGHNDRANRLGFRHRDGRAAVSPAVLGTIAFYLVTGGASLENVSEFFQRIIEGTPDTRTPKLFLAARSRLVTTAPLTATGNNITESLTNIQIFVRAYNLWRKGKDISKLTPPKIAPANSTELDAVVTT